MTSEEIGIEANKDTWRFYAECRGVDPNIFFPTTTTGIVKAKEYCRVCPVRSLCLEEALEKGEKFGIWGGASERERRRIQRRIRVSGSAGNLLITDANIGEF